MSARSGGRGEQRTFSPYLFGRGRGSRSAWSERLPGPYVPDETLRARRPLYYVAVTLVLLSLPLQQPVLFVAGLLVAVLAALPEVWYRFGLRALVVTHTLSASRAVFGDTVEFSLVAENRKALPLPWLEIDDDFPDALPVLGLQLEPSYKTEQALLRNTLALWAFQRVRRRYRVAAVARGVHTFGPSDLHLNDPFGILTREQRREDKVTLLVYPLLAPIERFGLSPRAPFGERAAPRRLLEDPLRVAGTRAYAPGDEPRRIHWKATARTGELHSKVYEPSARHTLALFLDVRTFKHVSMGYVPELAELAISITASAARWGIEQGYAVGLVSNGTLAASGEAIAGGRAAPGAAGDGTEEGGAEGTLAREIARTAAAFRLRVAPSSRPEQLTLLLDGLARLYPYFGAPMHELISGEHNALPPGATIVYIGAETLVDVPLIVTLRQARARGHAVSLLLTTPERPTKEQVATPGQEAEPHLAGLPTHRVGGETLWRELVADVLGPGPLRLASSQLDRRLPPATRRAILEGVHIATDAGAGDAEKGVADGDASRRAGRGGAPAGTRPLVVD